VVRTVTKLNRRLKKLESFLNDASGLVSHTKKWLEYWTRWFEYLPAILTFAATDNVPYQARSNGLLAVTLLDALFE
jgi:hypothetical protein